MPCESSCAHFVRTLQAHHAPRHGHGGLSVSRADHFCSSAEPRPSARVIRAVSARGRFSSSPTPQLQLMATVIRSAQESSSARPLCAPSPPGPLTPRALQTAPALAERLRDGPAWVYLRPTVSVSLSALRGASGRAEQGTTGWGRGGSGCPHCVRDDYGGQRERSRIARAAVPYCPAPDVSRSVILCPAGRSVASCVRPLWWTAELSTSRQTPGSTSPIDAGRGLTGGLLRSFSRSAASAIRCSRLLPTRELKSSLYFRAGRSLPHTQTDSAPRLPDTPQTTRQPASILATVRASVSFGGQTSCPRRSPTPDYHHQQSAQAGPLKKKTRDKRAEQSD